MTIRISTALENSLMGGTFKSKREMNSITLSLGDGDGAGGLDTINDSAGGLDVFVVGSFVTILTPDPDPNRNKTVKILSSTSTKLEVAAGSFTAYAAGGTVYITEPDIAGSFASIFKNCTFHLFNEYVTASADDAEPGIPICKISLSAGAFVPGSPENGLNFGDMVDGDLRRAINPATGSSEVWAGDPTATQAANSFICYANDQITGASIVSHRFSGSVTGPVGGGDMILNPSNALSIGTLVNVGLVKVELRTVSI